MGRILMIATALVLTACNNTKLSGTSDETSSTAQNTGNPPTDSNSNPDPAPSADDARLECESLKFGLSFLSTPLSAGSSVRNIVGSGIFSASRVAKITTITGSVIMLGTSTASTVDNISDVDGSILICDMDVTRVERVYGSVIVVGGRIGAVDQVTGSVLTVDGQIQGPVTNSTGSILAF